MTFTAGFALQFFAGYLSDYIQAIKVCDRLTRVEQKRYWFSKHRYPITHLDAFPPYFLEDDWYARYWFDEYENETQHINLGLFMDVDDRTRHDFRHFMHATVGSSKRRDGA